MDDNNITVKISGTAIYKAVKNYVDNSQELKLYIETTFKKLIVPVIENRVTKMLGDIEAKTKKQLEKEIEQAVKKAVEDKLATYISSGLKNLFEGPPK